VFGTSFLSLCLTKPLNAVGTPTTRTAWIGSP
jgi:hypothetical protein